MRTISLFIVISLMGIQLHGQSNTVHQEVEATIIQFFDAMRAADSTAIREAFFEDARLQSTGYDEDGNPYLQNGDIARFITSVGSYPAGMLDERLFSMRIEVDGPLATAWTDYTFYAGGKLSHCGVNAFQMVQTSDGWKIHQITDTRRKEACLTTDPADPDSLHTFIDNWHQAAAVADADAFFGAMAPNGIYIGTDASERWLRDELRSWAKNAFERESAWAFTASGRKVYYSADQRYAWWEELLDTWMGDCRGSGVAVWDNGRWQILHYHLSVTVPNDKIQGFINLVKD